MLIESMAGKSGALHGTFQDATPFAFHEKDKVIDHFGEQLRAAGWVWWWHGLELLWIFFFFCSSHFFFFFALSLFRFGLLGRGAESGAITRLFSVCVWKRPPPPPHCYLLYAYYGSEPLYSGITGTLMHADIFIGLVYYQRLRHMVSDKSQVIACCVRALL
ncbi:unnamed protein product [Discosporangium mesarthrocarpum]